MLYSVLVDKNSALLDLPNTSYEQLKKTVKFEKNLQYSKAIIHGFGPFWIGLWIWLKFYTEHISRKDFSTIGPSKHKLYCQSIPQCVYYMHLHVHN